MSKNEQRRYIILAVIFIVFSVIAFAAPFNKNGVFWLSYLFGVIAILFQIYVFKIAFSDGADIKSKFYGFPIARVGVIYLTVQLVLSLIQMAASGYLKTWMAAIINIIPVALAVIGTIAADVMREEVKEQEVIVKRNIGNMRELQALSASLPALTNNQDLKKKLDQLAEEFRYSDPVTNDGSSILEDKLFRQLDQMKDELTAGDVTKAEEMFTAVLSTLNERNKACKESK